MITFKRIYRTLSCTSAEIQEKYLAKRYEKRK